MFNNNKNKSEKLIEKSQGYKSVFNTLRINLEKSNSEMINEEGRLNDDIFSLEEKKVQLKNEQIALRTETISNENVIKNIDKILGTTE